MTDLGAAKALLPALILVYALPVFQSLNNAYGSADYSWNVAHCALPLIAYAGKVIRPLSSVPSDVDVVFSNVDIPYQMQFQMAILLVSSTFHFFLAFTYGLQLLNGGAELVLLQIWTELSSLVAVTTTWCLYTVWELRRVNATDTPVARAWMYIILGTVFHGPAATLAYTWSWRTAQLAKARSFQHKAGSAGNKMLVGYGRRKPNRLYGDQ